MIHSYEEALLYGVDWDTPSRGLTTENADQTMLVDDIRCPFTREQMRLLETEVDPYSESSSFGCDIYLKAYGLIREN